MSSLAFLVTELQSLASETRRKHPEIREAAEKSLAILRASPEQATANLAADGPQSEELLKPVLMGCSTKTAKVVAISLGSLQRLIALKAVPQSSIQLIINTMGDAMSQGVDIQLRILQTLLSLITNFPSVHGELLGDALLLCFKLQESRIAVVSSTAAATLRQLVMFVFDKMTEEDGQEKMGSTHEVVLPNGSKEVFGPSSRDAYSVFEDLCLLANSEKPNFLKLEFLHKTFGLELIESVLTNYYALFRKHPQLILLVQHHLCPLLHKALSDRPTFPLTLRCTRVVFLLLKQFANELETESEVFLMLLIRIIGEEGDGADHHPRPHWMRVLGMEIMRGLCSDADLMRTIYARYDASSSSDVFGSLISSLKRLLTEKPNLLGVCSDIWGTGVQHEEHGQGMIGLTGMVANAASATVSGVVGMMSSATGLSLESSAMKLQCIDQLDKADAPAIPEAYIYLLGVQCLVSLADGMSSTAYPLYTKLVVQKQQTPRIAPPAFSLSSLPPDDLPTRTLQTISNMVNSTWPAFLAAFSFIISTNLSDELFVEVLSAYQAMTNLSGILALTTPRDAFLASLEKYAVPARVVSALDGGDSAVPPTPRTPSITENLGLTAEPQQPSLSERNLACLKALVNSAMFLAGNLDKSWFGVMEALQNAEYVLTAKGTISAVSTTGPHSTSNKRASILGGIRHVSSNRELNASSRHPLLTDLEPELMLRGIQRLFDASKNLDDGAFQDFLGALCKLSSEMVGMQTRTSSDEPDEGLTRMGSTSSVSTLAAPTTPRDSTKMRRASGIYLPKTLRSGDFGLNKLGGVAQLNIHRLVYRSADIAWDTLMKHLLSIISHPASPQSIRVQAAKVFDDVLIVAPRNVTTSNAELQAEVQTRVLDALAEQVMLDPSNDSPASNAELRKMGLETLHTILQSSGHTLVTGWESIFKMLGNVTKPPSNTPNASTSALPITPTSSTRSVHLSIGLGFAVSDKTYSSLVKIAFQSLSLACDSVSLLSNENMRLLISTLGQFGRQADTNIALTAAESLMWSVSDSIQSQRKNEEQSELWMFLLLEVLGLCTDSRSEVRVGAIQTLFRTLQLYGHTLTLETWDQIVWQIIFPLLDSITEAIRQASGEEYVSMPSPDTQYQAWNDSKILALQSTGSVLNDFMDKKIILLESFPRVWDTFVLQVQDAVLLDHRSITAPALRCLETAINALPVGDNSQHILPSCERVWTACDEIGGGVIKRSTSHPSVDNGGYSPFTQESLVAFVDVIQTTRKFSRQQNGIEWSLERLTRLISILKGVLTYPNSPDYRPDIDSLSPIQSVVLDTITGIDLQVPGSPSLILQNLSEYATLPFLAAFDGRTRLSSTGPAQRVTYIALSKKAMPMLVDIFARFKDSPDCYADGTLEAILSAYSIPVKLKYDCPAPSKFGRDPPLWKTATSNFLRALREFMPQLCGTLGQELKDDRLEGIWRCTLDVFRGGILADCSAARSFSYDEQEAEENFDLALVASLEVDVVPHLGNLRIPNNLACQLGKLLAQASRLFESDEPDSPSPSASTRSQSPEFEKVTSIGSGGFGHGSTDLSQLVPRERFSYWCFDLLFLICSDSTRDQEQSRRRLAALSLPSLLNRCRSVLVGYVADESLRGNLPFPRAREEELLYVLKNLLNHSLYPGSLWAALSDSPTEYCIEQPGLAIEGKTPSAIIADAINRSTVAHLFHFYPVLCEVASIPRKTPISRRTEHGKEVDARSLARQCLRKIGQEMGVEH